MTVSTNSWIVARQNIINKHYLQKRLHPKFILGIIKKIFWEKNHQNQPWLTADSINIINGYLQPDDVVLEFGSGQSTLWFAGKTTNLTSVENNRQWYQKIQKNIQNKSPKIKLILGTNKKDYLKVLKNYSNNSIDICLVDGQWRRDCLLGVFKKIKIGGLIILDNAETFLPIQWPSLSFQDSWQQRGSPEKEKVLKIVKELKKWRIISTTDVSQDTVIFIKKNVQ